MLTKYIRVALRNLAANRSSNISGRRPFSFSILQTSKNKWQTKSKHKNLNIKGLGVLDLEVALKHTG